MDELDIEMEIIGNDYPVNKEEAYCVECGVPLDSRATRCEGCMESPL